MKSGLTIVEMAQQIERQSKLKQDYLLDTRRLQVEPFGSQLYLHTFDDHDDPLVEPLEINQIAHRQIGTHLKIPAAYYDRMLSDYPELLAENVNSWFQREPTQRMVRTLDGTVRAFLSNRYRRIDNLDIAEIVLPVIQQMEDAYFESCQITDSRMYIKVVNKRLEAEVVPGDIVQSGVIISNSEVGLGSVNIQPLVYRLVCSNGMVVNDAQTRRTHIGRVNEADENFQLFSQETLAADDHAFAMKIKDTVMAAVDETRGEMLYRNGAIFPAYYHSCCGGLTEHAHNVWDGERGGPEQIDQERHRHPHHEPEIFLCRRDGADVEALCGDRRRDEREHERQLVAQTVREEPVAADQ